MTVLFPQWDFIYWWDDTFVLDQGPGYQWKFLKDVGKISWYQTATKHITSTQYIMTNVQSS